MDAAVKGKSSQIGRARQFLTEVHENGAATKQYKCNICATALNGSCGSNLVAHFKSRHKDVYNTKINISPEDTIAVQRLKLLYSCVELVAINSQPFSLLTCSGFKNVIQHKLQALQLAGHGLNLNDPHVYEIKQKVMEVAKNIKQQVKLELKGRLLSVMVDGASRNGRSIFGINVQYKIAGELKVVTLAMRELKNAHTADYLANVFQEVLAEYGIDLSQILTITTDNGSNMLAMVRNLENRMFEDCENDVEMADVEMADSDCQAADSNEDANDDRDMQNFSDELTEKEIEQILESEQFTDEDALNIVFDDSSVYLDLLDKLVAYLRKRSGNHHLFITSIKCAAHTLQLAVNDALKLLGAADKNSISLCRLVAKFLRLQSTRNEMHRANLKSILPKLDVETRWSSTYMMVRYSNLNFLNFVSIILN